MDTPEVVNHSTIIVHVDHFGSGLIGTVMGQPRFTGCIQTLYLGKICYSRLTPLEGLAFIGGKEMPFIHQALMRFLGEEIYKDLSDSEVRATVSAKFISAKNPDQKMELEQAKMYPILLYRKTNFVI